MVTEEEKILKVLYENIAEPVNQVWISFPLSYGEKAEQAMLELRKGHETESSIPFRIARVEAPIPNLRQYLSADAPVQKISQLAEKIEGMGQEEQIKFSGALECRPISTIEDILQVANSLHLYDYFPGVTCSRHLGGYVVEHGIMKFPKRVWPYLDYHGIGEEYYVSCTCAYTKSGLVVLKEEEQNLVTEALQDMEETDGTLEPESNAQDDSDHGGGQKFRLYSPLTLRDRIGQPLPSIYYFGTRLGKFREVIQEGISRSLRDYGKSGLAEELSNQSLRRKISSMIPDVEIHGRLLWGVLRVCTAMELTEQELAELMEEWKVIALGKWGVEFAFCKLWEGYTDFYVNIWDTKKGEKAFLFREEEHQQETGGPGLHL